MTTIKELLTITDTSIICEKINRFYETSHIDDFAGLIEQLKTMAPEQGESEFSIYIKVFRKVEDDYEFAEEFDDNDTSLFYDVCGADDKHDCYSIVNCPFAAFLGYVVQEQTMNRFSPAVLLAHCLWEVTFFGFSDEERMGCISE